MLFLGYTLGKRIRYYRKHAGMTQKELAEAVGLSEPAIRNYELDNRTPDRDTLTWIADALKVSYYALDMFDMSEINRIVHFLFEMEEMYQLKPAMIDGELVLRFDTKRLRELYGDDPLGPLDEGEYDSENDEEISLLTEEEEQELMELLQKIPDPGAAIHLENSMGAWYDAYEDLQDGRIDQDTYDDWKAKFPAFAGFDESDTATLFDKNQMMIPVELPEGFWEEFEEFSANDEKGE